MVAASSPVGCAARPQTLCMSLSANPPLGACAQQCPGCAGGRGVRHRCVMPQAMPVPLPYPRIFAGVSRYGDAAPAPQQVPAALHQQPWNQATAAPGAQRVCPCLACGPNGHAPPVVLPRLLTAVGLQKLHGRWPA